MIALIVFVVLAVTASELIVWIFEAPPADPTTEGRSAIVRSLFIVLIGVVGLPLAFWRGLTAHRQANTANASLDATREQIAALQDNNLATQLQSGAELISESNNSKVEAGLVILGSLGAAKRGHISQSATDLLASYIGREHKTYHNDEGGLCRSAVDALKTCYEAGYSSNRKLYFRAEERSGEYGEDIPSAWLFVLGVRHVSYDWGEMRLQTIPDISEQSYEFDKVTFYQCSIGKPATGLGFSYRKCTFVTCEFKVLNNHIQATNVFRYCDFSGTEIADNFEPDPACFSDCEYNPANPPRTTDGEVCDLSGILKPRQFL